MLVLGYAKQLPARAHVLSSRRGAWELKAPHVDTRHLSEGRRARLRASPCGERSQALSRLIPSFNGTLAVRAVLNRALSRSEHNVDFEFCSKHFLTQLCFEYPSKRSCVILAVRPVEQARSLAVLFCCSLACCTLVSFALLLVQRVMWVAHVLNGMHDSALMFERDPITIVRRHLQVEAVRLHRST
jgi:hypothetical protein